MQTKVASRKQPPKPPAAVATDTPDDNRQIVSQIIGGIMRACYPLPFAILCLFTLTGFASAGYEDDVRASIALALASNIPVSPPVQQERLPLNKVDICNGIPADRAAELAQQSRPVMVWVNYKCPSSASQVSAIHLHTPTYLGSDKPSVVILQPCKPKDGSPPFLTRERVVDAAACCANSLANAPQAPQQHATMAAPRGGA